MNNTITDNFIDKILDHTTPEQLLYMEEEYGIAVIIATYCRKFGIPRYEIDLDEAECQLSDIINDLKHQSDDDTIVLTLKITF